MTKVSNSLSKRGLFTKALFGAVGFGIGGVIAGSLSLFNPENPVFPLTWAIIGASGGASLGLVLRSWKKTGMLALAGGLGFVVGSWPVLFAAAMALTELPVHPNQSIFAAFGLLVGGGIQGAIGTLALWLVLKSRTRVGWLMATGAAGFAIGAETSLGAAIGFQGTLILAIWGVLGGAALGATLGYWQGTPPTLN